MPLSHLICGFNLTTPGSYLYPWGFYTLETNIHIDTLETNIHIDLLPQACGFGKYMSFGRPRLGAPEGDLHGIMPGFELVHLQPDPILDSLRQSMESSARATPLRSIIGNSYCYN